MGSRSWARRECTKWLFLHSDHWPNLEFSSSQNLSWLTIIPMLTLNHSSSFSTNLCVFFFSLFFFKSTCVEQSQFIQFFRGENKRKNIWKRANEIGQTNLLELDLQDWLRLLQVLSKPSFTVPPVTRATEFRRNKNQKPCLQWCKWEFIAF